jgi:hypothetical protein
MSFDNSPNPYASPDGHQREASSERPLDEYAKTKLMGPGIALLIIGIIGLLGMGGYFFLMVAAINTPNNPDLQPPPEFNAEERSMFFTSIYGVVVVMGVSALAQILVILGAINFIRMKGRAMAMVACVVSLIPVASACCVLGIPFGIWGIVAMSDADVKQVFR